VIFPQKSLCVLRAPDYQSRFAPGQPVIIFESGPKDLTQAVADMQVKPRFPFF
jgi:hypothetical protein